MSALVFGSLGGDEHARTIEVPSDISSKDELLSVLATRLEFPSHFGRNWDALLDMLRDLSWLSDEEVRLVHVGVPVGLGSAWTTYLQVVADAVAARHAAVARGFTDRPRLLVVVPESDIVGRLRTA